MNIGLFDSGIGGLTVLKEIIKESPNNRFIYLADTANAPYGSKSFDDIMHYIDLKMRWMRDMKVDVLFMACNTCDAILDYKYTAYFKYGIVRLIYPAVHDILMYNNHINRIGLIATEATVKSQAYETAFYSLNANIKMLSIPCPMLVPWIESNIYNNDMECFFIEKYINPLIEFDIDGLVLGCTHYKFISKDIMNIFKRLKKKILLFDPGSFTSKKIKLFDGMQQNYDKFSAEFYITDFSAKDKIIIAVKKLLNFEPQVKLTSLI